MNRKNIVITILFLIIGFMSVAYAALARQLDITGTGNLNANWEIEFTSITEGTMVGATTVGTPTASGTSATFEANLFYPGASATYVLVVENKGSIDAVLESITGVDTSNTAEPIEIQYSVSGVAPNDELDAGETHTLQVQVKWSASSDPENPDVIPDTTQKQATIHLNYVQNTP